MLAGCGGDGPTLERSAAGPLIALAHRLPGEDACAEARDIRALQARAVSLVNAGRVPAALQEPLLSGVAALAEQTPVCLPKVAASTPSPPPSPSPAPSPTPGGKAGNDGKHGEKEHGHRHGKGKKR